jgi:hypothetical protein
VVDGRSRDTVVRDEWVDGVSIASDGRCDPGEGRRDDGADDDCAQENGSVHELSFRSPLRWYGIGFRTDLSSERLENAEDLHR